LISSYVEQNCSYQPFLYIFIMLHSACSFLAVLSSMSGLQVRAIGLNHSKYKSSL
jgi:hypothetical protein